MPSNKLELEESEPLSVAAYIEQLGAEASKPTVKQHLAAIRKLFDYLTTEAAIGSWPKLQERVDLACRSLTRSCIFTITVTYSKGIKRRV